LCVALWASCLPAVAGAVVEMPAQMPHEPRYVFEPIGDDAGLAQRASSSIIQDSLGFVWIGTMDGLYRCDGFDVQFFGPERGMPHARIVQVVETPGGTVLASTIDGIFRFDGVGFVPLKLPDGASLAPAGADVRQSIAVDAGNRLYVATAMGIVTIDLRDPRNPLRLPSPDGAPEGPVVALSIDLDGQLWFVSDHQVGTISPETGGIELVPLDSAAQQDVPIAVLRDGAGTVWLRLLNRVLRMDPGETAFVEDGGGIAESGPGGIPTLDREGRLLVPSTVGLYLHGEDHWRLVSASNGLRSNGVTYAFEDREGTLWIGLYGVGVQLWRGRAEWAAWTAAEGLPDSSVWGSYRDDRGRLWVATNDGIGVWQPERGAWKTIRHEDGLVAHRVWKFARGPGGWVWSISRRAGLNRFHPDRLTPETIIIPEHLTDGAPLELSEAPDGSLWVGLANQMVRIGMRDGEMVFEPRPYPPGSTSRIEEISFAQDGTVWIAGTEGLDHHDGERWRHFGVDDGLRVEGVRCVVAVDADEAWIGYRETTGVSHVKRTDRGVTLRHFDRSNGLADDRVWMVDRDRQGQIWVGGSEGVSVIAPDGTITVHDRGDGLIWPDIGQGGFSAEEDGTVLLGTSMGLAYFKPSTESRLSSPPPVVITSAVLGDVESVNQPPRVVPFGHNTFEATFAGLTYRNPARVVFKCQLVGWDDKPRIIQQRHVRYAALPPGPYTLEVWCRSARGIWSDAPATFSFEIDSPWWQRWWARLGGAGLLVALGLTLSLWRIRRLYADRRRLEQAVSERNAELAKANDELRELTYTDALTKVRNRRYFSTVIGSDVALTIRKHDPRNPDAPAQNRDLLFMLIDFDHFKGINDNYGHLVGDQVLAVSSQRVVSAMRESDLVVRWGGEEFLVVCRDSERGDAPTIAARILEAVGGSAMTVSDGLELRITCSVGWAALPAYLEAPTALHFDQVLALADKALYAAKGDGRNQAVGVSMAGPAPEDPGDLSWLEVPLEELEGDRVTLIRIRGPE